MVRVTIKPTHLHKSRAAGVGGKDRLPLAILMAVRCVMRVISESVEQGEKKSLMQTDNLIQASSPLWWTELAFLIGGGFEEKGKVLSIQY